MTAALSPRAGTAHVERLITEVIATAALMRGQRCIGSRAELQRLAVMLDGAAARLAALAMTARLAAKVRP